MGPKVDITQTDSGSTSQLKMQPFTYMITVLNYRYILDALELNLDHLRNKGHIATMWNFNIWCPDITRDRERSSNSHSTRMENFIRTRELTALTTSTQQEDHSQHYSQDPNGESIPVYVLIPRGKFVVTRTR